MLSLLRKTFSVVFAVAFVCQFSFAQELNLQEKLSLDPKVKKGKLPNGLTYFIRQNKKPEQKVELRLVVNAGSILEDEDQQGIAHLNEHMAFNGTKHFKKNDIVSFLQDIGVTFGNDLNAYTSFDETVYILPIPTDKPGNLDKGFQVLEDWAHNATYLTEDIDNERPIVMEENRKGKGADDRMFRKILPLMLENSKYAVRLPGGIDSILKHTPGDAVRRFYKTWYRPDLMAVIVVGDIDPAVAETMVKKYFSGLTNPADEKNRDYATVPAYTKPSAIVVTDKEATSYSVQLMYPAYKKEAATTVGGYRDDIVKDMFTGMLNQRLQELTQRENPPFVFAGTGFGSFARGYEAFQAFASSGTSDIKNATKTLVEEIERVKQFGFTDAELDRMKKSTLTQYERSYNNREKTESENFVQEYVQMFLENEPSPGIEKEYEYVKAMLPTITIGEVNAVAGKFRNEKNFFVAITGPQTDSASLPTADQLIAMVQKQASEELKKYEEKAVATSLLTTMPSPGKVVSKTTNALLGTTELKLSNGVTVTLKPTDFNNDQILLGATRKGGKNNYGLADKYNAQYATDVVTAMGVGNFSPTDLRKALAGKSVSVSPRFTDVADGVRGTSTVRDFETMLQLNYLYFTAPRMDSSLFRSWVQRNKSQYMMLMASPEVSFIDTVFKTMFNNNPLAPIAIPRPEYYDKVNLDRAVSIYKERFGNANQMEFVIVGKFSIDSITPLIEKYIASLPSDKSKTFTYVDNKVRPAAGKKRITLYKGTEQKSMIFALYAGEVPYSEDLAFKADALSEVLNIIVIEELREKVKGIYGGGTSADVNRVPYPNYTFSLQLPCGPEKVDTLLKVAKSEFKNMTVKGPKATYIKKVKAQYLETRKTAMKENQTWLSKLLELKMEGGNPDRFIHYEKYINALTAKDVQDAAKIMFSKNELIAVLMPEDKKK